MQSATNARTRLILESNSWPSNSRRVPVLLLGTGATALGVMRCLGRSGIPIYCITPTDSAVRVSRWFKRLPFDIKELEVPEELESFLRNLELPRAVLIACGDDWLKAVSLLPKNLRSRFPYSSPSYESVEILTDKGLFGNLLKELALPHPGTITLNDVSDLDAIDDLENGRWFLKPRDSFSFFEEFGAKAVRVFSRSDAGDRLETFMRAGHAMALQEYVPGPSSNHYYIEGFIDRHHAIKACFARQRIRIHPPDFGNSTYMTSVSVEVAQPACMTIESLMQHLSYRGVFSAEFKLDSLDGQFKLLEVNARPWWYIEVPFKCGINLAQMIYLDALQENVPSVDSYESGLSFYSPYFDLAACQLEHRENRLSYYSWFRSWSKGTQVFYNWSDPMPTIRTLFALSCGVMARMVKPKHKRSKDK